MMHANNSSVAKTENKAKVVATFFCWQRNDISKDLFTRYWRDVHAIWAARTPGFYQYRQLHLDPVDPTLLSDLAGIETDLPKADQPDGMAHIFYSSTFMANLLRKPFALKQATEDEAYFVSCNTYQRSALPLSRTYLDKVSHPDSNGSAPYPRYVLAFKKGKAVTEKAFWDYLTQQWIEPWRKRDDVQRLRLELLESYVAPPATPNGTDHHWDEDKQYHAWIELWLTADADLYSFFHNSDAFKQHISAVHAYPIREIYTIVFGGRPTLVGLRGYQAAQTIEEAGAAFQKSKAVLKFTYGPTVHGGRLISPSVYVGLISAVIIGILLFLQLS